MPSGDTTLIAVTTLRPGQDVIGVFACTRKDRLMTRTGSPYLALELRDRTGTVSARAFQNADALAGKFERGDVVRVAGKVERFRDELVLEVSDVARMESGEEFDPAQFLPSAYRDLDELDGFLEHLCGEVYDRGYREMLDALLADAELRVAWAPGALYPRGSPRLPRRAARAHGRGGHAGPRDLPAAPAAELRSAPNRGDHP